MSGVNKKDFMRKLKIENLTRCLNCSRFPRCGESFKENVVECERVRELPTEKQVVVVKLSEWSG
jgi:hypothetical protein